MKTLPSMSGLLPAQFKSDPASVGIGWGTINPIIKSVSYGSLCLSCGEDIGKGHECGRTVPCTNSYECSDADLGDSDKIKVGDVVYVKPDYKNECWDTLKAGGVYVVHEASSVSLKLRDKPRSHVPHYSVKKIKDRSKVIVSAIINNGAKVVEGEIVSTDGSNMPIMIKTEYGTYFWCYEDTVFIKEDNQ